MHARKQSLLEYLRTPNPRVRGDLCSKKRNSSSKCSYECPRTIRKWEDFKFETLNQIYDGKLGWILGKRFELQDFCRIAETPFCRPGDENSLDSLLTVWNHQVVVEALSKAQPLLHEPHDYIVMVRGGQVNPPSVPKRLRPDWGCARSADIEAGNMSKNLLPGDSKVGCKWTSSLIPLGEVEKGYTGTAIEPIKQIYTYCLENNTRYGFILTDKELVAVRVCMGKDFGQQRSFDATDPAAIRKRARGLGILDFKAIPWTASTATIEGNRNPQASQPLTVNLALWWLHLISISNTRIGEDYGALRDAVWDCSMASAAVVAAAGQDDDDDDDDSDDGDTEEDRESQPVRRRATQVSS